MSNYQKLNQLLAEKKWKEADIETRKLMLEIAGSLNREDCLLTEEDIKNFPCSELKKIDQLWIKYSQGRFGFSIILNIFEEVGENYGKLAEKVGWKVGDKWLAYNDLQFTNNAPIGHLPITWLVPITFWMYWLARFASPGWGLLLNRLKTCKMNRP